MWFCSINHLFAQKSPHQPRSRRSRLPISLCLILIAVFTVFGLFLLDLRSIDPPSDLPHGQVSLDKEDISVNTTVSKLGGANIRKNCATVEQMGEIFRRGYSEESLRVRRIIHSHFALNGASRVRELRPEQFCRHGFVIGKASEAGLGNELYKLLTAAALSVMLNRSLIIGQTRGQYPFGDYIYYSNISFTLKEIKRLWRQNGCLTKYGRHLTIRIDDFLKPTRTDVLCSNWREWEHPIIWFQNTTDAVAAQFFLKNIHSEMKEAASDLFGRPENLEYRANVFGELMKILVSPSREVEEAITWALNDGTDPDIALHMRMMMSRSVRAKNAAMRCVRKAILNLPGRLKPKVALVSETPSMINDMTNSLKQLAEVIHFDYSVFDGNISGNSHKSKNLDFRVKDWGPAPRWVAFVDFFLAARAKYAVISGAQRRVGTTYVQLIAALAAAYRLEEDGNSTIAFLSSFQSNLVSEGLKNQVGWGHVWNRFNGILSCAGQEDQCAPTPILPPAWWDGVWQSPIPHDIQKMEAYGIKLSGLGTFDENHLHNFCQSRKKRPVTIQLI